MTVIQVVKDPVTRKDLTLAEGHIKRVNMVAYPEKQVKQVTRNGVSQAFESTHKASILLTKDGTDVWINLGDQNSKYGNLQIKEGEKYIDIVEGMEVSLVVTPNEYNGKTYYNSKRTAINILDASGAVAPTPRNNTPTSNTSTPSSGSNTKVYGVITKVVDGVAYVMDENKGDVTVVLGNHTQGVEEGKRMTAFINAAGEIVGGFKTYDKISNRSKDNYGQMAGGAANVALNFVDNLDNLLEISKKCFLIVEEVKDWALESHPELDEKNLGFRAGQSVNLAANYSNIEDLFETSKRIFDILCDTENHIKIVKESPVNTPKTTEPVTTVPATTGTKRNVKSKQESKVIEAQPPMDFDDDIPF